jgi:tRNA threonylcarbamoyladenosine biosynthesis protein TsaB
MRILAIETVGTSGSVAALERDRVLAERELEGQRRAAQSLVPSIAKVLGDVGWRAADVELVAVATGPGSFTGLRIGVTTAKAFAYAAGSQAIGVPTMSAIAARVPDAFAHFWTVVDAQRNELYAAEFMRDQNGRPVEAAATQIVGAESWLASLVPGVAVSGPGLERLVERVRNGVIVVDRALWAPTAAAVGQVGWQRYSMGERTSVFDLVPHYYRKSAAEERHTSG